MLKQLRENKICKIVRKIIGTIFTIFIIAFVLAVYLQRFSDNKISFFNFRMFTVVTPSMEPRYNVGDVLLSKEIPASEVKAGDDISYVGRVGDVKDKIVTHEVRSVDQDTKGQYKFRAKGLNNIIEDPTVYEDQLLGVIVYKVKTLSFVYKIISTQIGFYLCIIVPLVGIIGYEIAITLSNSAEKRLNKENN